LAGRAQTIEVLLLTTKVGGLGLNLTGADTVGDGRNATRRTLFSNQLSLSQSDPIYFECAQAVLCAALVVWLMSDKHIYWASFVVAGNLHGARLEPCG
jgi:hypothetical protein